MLLKNNHGNPLCDPIVLAAGSDITNWFDPDTKQPKTWIDPVSNSRDYYCPSGRYLHIPPKEPHSNWDTKGFETAWWDDVDQFMIGRKTTAVRKIRIVNTLTKHDDIMDVCSEETMNEILDRYLELNVHAASYTWKRLGKVLDMN